MFSPLARGSANWDGGIELELNDNHSLPDDLLLPQILLKSKGHQIKSSKSLDSSIAYNDGQLLLPKTYVTRKGALLLFTPSEELLIDEADSRRPPTDVYQDGLTLKTIGNLANSVLQFGKEEEQAWEGIPCTPPTQDRRGSNHGNQHQPIKDRKAFLHFLHYLDSESLTADKHAQPGCDPEFYLDELKSSSRALNSGRRSGDVQTIYSCRTYTSLLEDDDMSDIVREYIKWNKLEKQLQQEQMGKEENADNDEDLQGDADNTSSPVHHGHTRRPYSISPQYFYGYEETLRPSTAPLPPAPETPRANPRITSGKRPPPQRALGSTPDRLDKILRADLNPARNNRRGPSPRLKFSRNTSPTFYPASSRGGSPDHGLMPRFETPGGLSESWSRAEDVIQEVDETECPATRPTSVASYNGSAHSSRSKDHSHRKASSAGTVKDMEAERATNIGYVSGSGSMSSVSYQKGARTMSGKSRANTRSLSKSSIDYHDDQQEIDKTTSFPQDDSCVVCAPPPSARMTPRSMSTPRESRTLGVSTSSMSTLNQDGDRATSPSRDVVTQSRMSRGSGGSFRRSTSRISSTNDREQSPDNVPRDMSRVSTNSKMSSRHENTPTTSPWINDETSRGLSRGSGRLSKTDSSILKENRNGEFRTLNDFGGRGLALRSRSATTRNPKIPTRLGSGHFDANQSRPVSAPVSIPGDGTNATLATLGSEANIADVIEVMSRHHAYVEDSDEERELDSPDVTWPVNADGELDMTDDELSGYGSAAEEVNLDLPPSPVLTSSSAIFRLDSSWSPAPPIETTEGLLVPREPSETGATGFQSRSPSPTPKLRTPALVSTGIEDDSDSVVSAYDRDQWPPERSQARPPTPLTMPATPLLPTVTINEEGIDGDTKLLTPTSPPTSPPTSLPTSPTIYQETIDIERSRPSSPVTELDRQQPVSVSKSVIKYLKTAHEPAERPRSGKSRTTPDVNEPQEKEELISEENTSVEPAPQPNLDSKTVDVVDNVSTKKEKPKSAAKEKAEPKLAIEMNNAKDRPKTPLQKQQESTLEEAEARRDYVSSLLNKTQPTIQRGRLELEGIGKEGEEGVSESVAPARPFVFESPKKTEPAPVKPAEPARNDLSDLAALINRNKSAKAQKEKKEVKKKPKVPKSSKKEIQVDPQNIDFNAFNTPEMLQHMDDDLKQLIQQGNLEGTPDGSIEPASNMQNVDLPQVAPDKKNAYAPSKSKKLTKQEMAKKRADARKAEKKRKEEERKTKEEENSKREEELRLAKEKEEEQTRARQEAEFKQHAIVEERTKRLADEEDARREEEEAIEKLKDAKKKAREEREQRRAAEAERRKLEVQRKREEKKKKEEDMREKEKETEQMKVDQEKRRQELMEAKRRQEELDRVEDERRLEEDRLRLMEEEEEHRRLEEEQIREAEEELSRLQEEREYKEQMRRIAEARETKLKEQEEERLRKEEEERRVLEEEQRKIQEEAEKKAEKEKKRFNIARRLEAVARMRIAHEAARRKTILLKRREENIKRMEHLRNVRHDQGITSARIFSYYVRIPRQVWEVPIGYSKQKKGFRGVKKKPPPKQT